MQKMTLRIEEYWLGTDGEPYGSRAEAERHMEQGWAIIEQNDSGRDIQWEYFRTKEDAERQLEWRAGLKIEQARDGDWLVVDGAGNWLAKLETRKAAKRELWVQEHHRPDEGLEGVPSPKGIRAHFEKLNRRVVLRMAQQVERLHQRLDMLEGRGGLNRFDGG
jgi:hypothetical protein